MERYRSEFPDHVILLKLEFEITMSNIDFLQWIVNHLWPELTPSYLQRLVVQEGYDPYKFNWDLQTAKLVKNYQKPAQEICTNTHPQASPPWTFSGAPSVNISGSVITGLSNVKVVGGAPNVKADSSGTYDGIVEIVFTFPALNINQGPFVLTQGCCQPPLGKFECSHNDPSDEQVGNGTYDLAIQNATGTCTFGVNVQPVLVDAQRIQLTVPDPRSDVSISNINIASIPLNSKPGGWAEIAENAFNAPDAHKALIDAIASAMNGANELQHFGSVLTTSITNWMNSGTYPWRAGATAAF